MDKADDALKALLAASASSTYLSVWLELERRPIDSGLLPPKPDWQQAQIKTAEDRRAFRRKLIDHRNQEIALEIGDTLGQLDAIGFDFPPAGHFGIPGKTNIIATPDQIKQALALKGVKAAKLEEANVDPEELRNCISQWQRQVAGFKGQQGEKSLGH